LIVEWKREKMIVSIIIH